ncbi:MAG: AraC family transcriptional regulator [Clostridia bacterium]|nr:AraC family transcriptional regulator [Clostridia bacterium]
MINFVDVADKAYNGFNPVQFGFENCEKSHYFGPAVRTHWLIHYVVSGNGYFRIQDRDYILKSGEMFVIPPFVETYYEADDQNPWEYIWVGFTYNGDLPLNIDDTVNCPEALRIFEDMKLCAQKGNGRTEFLCAKIWELFSLLLDRRKSNTDYVDRALSSIHAEYMNGITVQDIAARLNLDRTYFYAIFKKKTGVSPSQYITNYRMEQALDLMFNKGKNITVTANSVGYTDIYTFSKVFKRHFGSSPRKYIKMNK